MNDAKPNVFIIGAPRCMTTRIVSWMKDHSEICTSVPKEGKFFSLYYTGDDKNNQEIVNSYYRNYDGERCVVYSNPIDCNLEYVADRILAYAGPDAKIIMGIRQPIQRAISHWGIHRFKLPLGRVSTNIFDDFDKNYATFNKRKFISEGDFVPYCNSFGSCYVPQYMECSLYYNMYRMYRERFKNIYVYDINDFTTDNKMAEYNKILDFIGVANVMNLPRGDVNNLAQWGGQLDFREIVCEFIERYPDIVDEYVKDIYKLNKVLDIDLFEKWVGGL